MGFDECSGQVMLWDCIQQSAVLYFCCQNAGSTAQMFCSLPRLTCCWWGMMDVVVPVPEQDCAIPILRLSWRALMSPLPYPHYSLPYSHCCLGQQNESVSH